MLHFFPDFFFDPLIIWWCTLWSPSWVCMLPTDSIKNESPSRVCVLTTDSFAVFLSSVVLWPNVLHRVISNLLNLLRFVLYLFREVFMSWGVEWVFSDVWVPETSVRPTWCTMLCKSRRLYLYDQPVEQSRALDRPLNWS